MNTITKHLVLLILCLISTQLNAQDTIQKTTESSKKIEINSLLELKDTVKDEEREFLKAEVEAINKRLDNGEITIKKADELKKLAAKKRALNIENRIAIIDNKIELLKRNESGYSVDSNTANTAFRFSFGGEEDDQTFVGFRRRNKPRKYDKRTTNALVFAAGLNNAVIEGKAFGKSPYNFFESGFVELGWAWKTRMFKNSNAVRFKYGFSFQWNKFLPKNDKYFLQNGNTTSLEVFPDQLKESEFRVTNLVFPLHFEFGPSKKIEKDSYFRYSTHLKFKFGIGGYAGFNIGTQQKLRYKQDGDNVKEKVRRNYNTTDFVYGLSTYVGLDTMSLYLKYDLNTIFKDQAVDQNNVSLGIRFDLE